MLCIGVFLPKSAATTRFCRRSDTHSLYQLHPRPCLKTSPYSPISIRRAETSDRSGGFSSPYGSHNLSVSNWHRHCPKTSLYIPNSIRRAEASDQSGGFSSPYGSHNLSVSNWHRHCRSGGFTRLPPSTTYQTRVCLPALPEDQPLHSEFHTPSGS